MNNASKLSDTDLCVMCGMCLPHCPTYQLYQTETESPRGRIALMQAIDQKRINPDHIALLHIDHCLGCLNCETICPSRVPYGQLIDEFRDQFNTSIKKPLMSKIILRQTGRTNGINTLATIASKPLLKQFVQLAGSVGHLPSGPLTQTPASFKSFYRGVYTSPTECRGEVSLFTGCSGTVFDHRSIKDAIFLLNQLSFDVHIANNQSCCGALHQHNGEKQTAKQLLRESQAQLKQLKTDSILFFSPACGERLKQIEGLNVVDIRTFIFNELQAHPLAFCRPAQAIALHESCSHRNMLELKNLNFDLLNCVTGIQIIKSSNPTLCCGAGGIQSINYPQQAQALLQEKLASFDLTQTNILISDNIGCSLHIKTAISAYNPTIEIMHPVSFLARQFRQPI